MHEVGRLNLRAMLLEIYHNKTSSSPELIKAKYVIFCYIYKKFQNDSIYWQKFFVKYYP